MDSTSSQVPGESGRAQPADATCPEELPALEMVPEPPVAGVMNAGQPGEPPTWGPPGAATAMPGSYPPPLGYAPPGVCGPPPAGDAANWPKGYRPGMQMWDKHRGWYYPTPEEWQRYHSARRLVAMSHCLGWGGIAILFVGPPMIAKATRGSSVGFVAMGVVATLGGGGDWPDWPRQAKPRDLNAACSFSAAELPKTSAGGARR
jgi:hypothetical protein